MIKIIDCGSQLTQNIARRVRELGVFTEIVPFNIEPRDIMNEEVEGIIISGGQFSVYDENAPKYKKEVLSVEVPILGICYGHQSIAHFLGGKVKSTENREYGETKVKVLRENLLFKNIFDQEYSSYDTSNPVSSTFRFNPGLPFNWIVGYSKDLR